MKPDCRSLADVGYKYIDTPYSVMDCQAFVEKCLKDIGINMDLGGSNSWYREMTWVGTPEECKKKFGSIPPGAFLYIWKNDGGEPEKFRKDGIGNASHIGIFTDLGKGAIHSSYTNDKVCESAFSGKSINGGWNRVGLWNRLSYGTAVDDILNGKEEKEKPKAMKKALVETKNKKGVNFRERKTIYSRNFGAIPDGTIVDILEDLGEWYFIEYNGKNGYVMSEYLTVIADEEPAPGDISGDGTVAITLDSDLAYDLFCRLAEALGEELNHG